MNDTAVKERPILMRGEMVRAILDGRKTQTRRPIKNPANMPNYFPLEHADGTVGAFFSSHDKIEPGIEVCKMWCRYGKPGDRLWVRENIIFNSVYDCYRFSADGATCTDATDARLKELKRNCSRPAVNSIHMPRWACRLELEITGVRVERLQSISEADAQAEGVIPKAIDVQPGHAYRECFRELWNTIHAKDGYDWNANPWLWVIEFERLTKE